MIKKTYLNNGCKTLLFCFLLIHIGCKKNNPVNFNKEDQNKIIIQLTQSVDNAFKFDEIRSTDFPAITWNYKYPKLYKGIFEGYSGIPELDSLMIVSKAFQRELYQYDLMRLSYLEKKDILKQLNGLDSIKLSEKPLRYRLNAVSGFKDDKQIVIVDANNNKDFSDDQQFEFDINFGKTHNNSSKIIDSLPIINFDHQVQIDGENFNISRKIQIFPYPNNPHIYLLSNGTLDENSNRYTLMIKLKDYKKGIYTSENVKFNIGVQGLSPNYNQL